MYIALLLEENFISDLLSKLENYTNMSLMEIINKCIIGQIGITLRVEHWGLQLVLHFFVDALEQLLNESSLL